MKVKKIIFLLFLVHILNSKASSKPFIGLDSINLAITKERILNATASKNTLIAYKKLISDANNLLLIQNPTVINKSIHPPSGNKQDYLSISRYWWPNGGTKNGMPWIRKDGITNPETQTDAVDRKRLGLMTKGVWKLSLAYYFTNNEKYANKAISMIEAWFVDPKTLMNPHLEFAQSVPGNPDKRPTGILDGRSLVMNIPDAINLLNTSKHWNITYQTKTTKWFSDYLNWLTTSDLGVKGAKQKNNHGSWYKYQVASLAYYLGDTVLVKKMLLLAEKSLDEMLDNNGGQIHELARSRSFFYSCFNLQALTNIAVIGDKIGVDFWGFESIDKKSLSLAINYLIPIVEGEKWTHNTLKPIDVSGLIPIISKMAIKYNSEKYKLLLSKIITQSNTTKNIEEFYLLNNIF